MTGSDRPRRRYDEVLASALASGLTLVRAAELAGVSESTARRRAKDEGFTALVGSMRAELLSTITGRLLSLHTKALDALEEVLDEPDAPAARLRAAGLLLSTTLRYVDLVEVATRLTAVERKLSEIELEDPDSPGPAVFDPLDPVLGP